VSRRESNGPPLPAVGAGVGPGGVLAATMTAVLMVACAGQPIRTAPPAAPVSQAPAAPVQPWPAPPAEAAVAPSAPSPVDGTRRPGGYYLDDGPGASPPDNLAAVPDAIPRREPLNPRTQRPYTAMGRTYTPMTQLAPYSARGTASWYGQRYHGRATSSGEPYDMYAMTAAHPTLPIPSYARVTSVRNGRSVVVRVNDRGPFHGGRLIDLSYVAAWKLDLVAHGSGPVEVTSIIPGAGDAPPLAGAVGKPPPPLPPAVPLASGDRGLYVQLGAFNALDSAQDFAGKMVVELEGLAANLSVLARDRVFRVQAGPYRDRAAAEAAVAAIEKRMGFRPFVASR
jgi:rare lipoprotein A